MNTSAYKRIPVIMLAVLVLAACPWKKQKHHDEPVAPVVPVPVVTVFYVNAPAGADTNPGTQNSPFKTITHAMGAAKSGSTYHVASGIYDTLNNEIFPITVPAGVLLIGDETNKGGGISPTSIVGGGLAPGSAAGTVGVALLPGTGSTIAGFIITNNNGSFTDRRGLILGNSSVTLRNNTVTGATHHVGVYIDASTNHVIAGNRIVNNGAGSGLAFVKGGVGSKVENNVITGNGLGVEYDVAGGDLGGGSAGSAGGNVISCNTQNDLKAAAPTAITISAASNLWDRSPPTLACNAGDDICLGTATITATPATQASSPCLPPVVVSTLFYVDVDATHNGSDANPGTQSFPFKTITFAMTKVTSGDTVQVLPGIYDVLNNNETFPIAVPEGVLLIGDETNKGGGPTPTSIVGGGQVPTFPAGTSAAVHPGTGSTIAGFTITNDNPAFPSGRNGLFLSNSTVTLRNNTVTGAIHSTGIYFDVSTNHVITGNRIVDNGPGGGSGLAFSKGGVGSKVENNVITGNGFGVSYNVAGGDLGGGSAGSLGGNVISCNVFIDLYTVALTAITISAANNSWDHTPPTIACNFGGDDICDDSGTATVIATPAMLASPVCP